MDRISVGKSNSSKINPIVKATAPYNNSTVNIEEKILSDVLKLDIFTLSPIASSLILSWHYLINKNIIFVVVCKIFCVVIFLSQRAFLVLFFPKNFKFQHFLI